ncbi:hypothetical protein G7Y89_g9394 [Cudoniella acicularis]|uniref:Methyltransferase domain-containing protein n=1 Tax=Cudoniella acicularis TaxID=354080 RepID=A0A8H4W1X8_9HELO|nr:hypothetical protein G7Y89_g9394 [Cudoniella acicularis]
MTSTLSTKDEIYTNVEDAYGYRSENAIREALSKKIAVSLGYNPADMASVPTDANIGEGCGNPLLIASLKKANIAGSKMIALARTNAAKLSATNVEFVHTNINHLPLPDNSVDCVMSNCVLNLVPEDDKLSVIKEIHRILKPCGRLAVSDFLALKTLTPEIKNDPALHAGCVSGAVEVAQMKEFLFDIGFDDLGLYKDGESSKSVTPCCAGGSSCGPGMTPSGRKELDYDLNEWISSFQIYGHKWCGKTKQNVPQVCSVLDNTFETPSSSAAYEERFIRINFLQEFSNPGASTTASQALTNDQTLRKMNSNNQAGPASKTNLDPMEAERTRLRRNQRNSRARKQAYVQDLEHRWRQCVELGVQATAEMQREAQKVQEENRLLRAVLHDQGFDDTTLQQALEKAKRAERQKAPVQHKTPSLCGSNDRQNDSLPSVQSSTAVPPVQNSNLIGDQGDLPQTMDLFNWLDDLCQIKDALGNYNTLDDFGAQNYNELAVLPLQPVEGFELDPANCVSTAPAQLWPLDETCVPSDLTNGVWTFPTGNQNP